MNKIEKEKKPAKKKVDRAPQKKLKKNNNRSQYSRTANYAKSSASQQSRGKAGSQNRKQKKSLVPLLIILSILLILTSFMAFSEKSSFLSNIFSRNIDDKPVIERPEIVQNEIVKQENTEENSYSVAEEVEIKSEPEKPEEKIENPEAERTMKSRLFYVKVNDEGQISLKSVIRTVHYISTPLTKTMKSLILGPDRSDLNKGLLNLIPKDSEILSIKISQGIAYLNFNDNFRFNSLGIEGYKAQLMQIVYTATEFQSVDEVQILINGEIYDFLGAEGVFIGEPLNREYFDTF